MTVTEMNERKRELGYSYEQIAKLSGVPESTVRKVLGGITKAPRHATLLALSKAFRGRSITEEKPSAAYQTAVYGTQKKQGEYTLEDYLALPDERRVELIDGVIYDMSAPTGYHQLIAGRLYAMLLAFISEKGGGGMPFVSPVDVQLDCDDKTIVQPDVLILCDKVCAVSFEAIAHPNLVLHHKREDLFILDGILVPNYQELLLILDKLRHILPEKTERGICTHNIGLFQ